MAGGRISTDCIIIILENIIIADNALWSPHTLTHTHTHTILWQTMTNHN